MSTFKSNGIATDGVRPSILRFSILSLPIEVAQTESGKPRSDRFTGENRTNRRPDPDRIGPETAQRNLLSVTMGSLCFVKSILMTLAPKR